MLAANDNTPAIAQDGLWPALETEAPRGTPCCINSVAEDGEPHVLRNVAIYYRQKGQPWANSLAGMLMKASGYVAPVRSRGGANDNQHRRAGRRRAA